MKKEENLREDLQDLNIDEEFLAMTPKACPIKEKKWINWTLLNYILLLYDENG